MSKNQSEQSLSEIDSRKDLGRYGEQLVINYLQDRGFVILAKNYQQRFGEIDIIAQKSELVVFVEVKLRNNIYFNNSEIINRAKKNKIIKTAKYFVATRSIVDKVLRFDVAIVEKYFEEFSINYIENAFCSGE